MLIAIAIYKVSLTNNTFQKIKFAQQNKGLFISNSLENVEKNIGLHLQKLSNRILFIKSNQEFHYIQFLPERSIITLIISRKSLDGYELTHLFNNINIVYLKPEMKTTLDDIIMNPLGYLGKDILLTEINEDLNILKNLAIENVNKLIVRGELIEELQEKTQRLVVESVTFVNHTKKLNRCCGIF